MSKRELSPSEYEDTVSTGNVKSSRNPVYIKYGGAAVIAIVICGTSFVAGMSYQKGKQPSSTTNASANVDGRFPSQANGQGGMGGFGNGQRPNIGEVKAVSSDSITITSQRSNSDQTFKITGNTTIQNNGASASISDIKTGANVLVITDGSDSSTASQIMLNPSFGPTQGGASSTQSAPSSFQESSDDQSI